MSARLSPASRGFPAGALLLVLGAASTGLAPSADGDIWWHLAAGREMVARGELLWSDPFSVSALGRPWHDVHWLFQLAVHAVHRWFGLSGLVFVKCALLGLGAGLLYSALDARRSPWTRGLFVTVLLGGLLACRSLLLVRPVIGTLVLMAFFFVVLERFQRDGRARPLLWLLPAQVVWANFQGLSALGPALVGAYALGAVADARFGGWKAWPFAREALAATTPWSRAKLLSATLAGCLAATCLTPFGWGAVALPATLLGRLLPGEQQIFARQVAENLPPFELERLTGGEFWHFKWSLALLALAALAAGRRMKLSHALVLLGFATLALMSNRNVLLLYWLGAPLSALYLAPALRALVGSRLGRQGLRAGVALNAAALVALGLVSGAAAAQEPTLSEPSPFRAPSGSAERLAALPQGADVFAADHYGGYLIWRLYPRFRPYIDTRLVLRSDHEYAQYLRVVDEPERFDQFQATYRFGYVVLPVMFPERYQGLVAHLAASAEWKLLFTDGSEVLFGRRDLTAEIPEQKLGDAADAARVRAELALRYGDSSKAHVAALTSLATLHGLLGQHELAERALAGVHAPEAAALTARLRFAAGDLAGAERLAGARLSDEREDVRSLNLLAQIALRRGEDARSLSYLRRALRARPSDPEAQRLLANLEENRP
jgi:hypothetical protein